MIGKDLGDGGRGIGVRPRRKTGGRRKWDARYTKKCITKVTDCQVICCVSFERSGKLKKMRLPRVWKCVKLGMRAGAGNVEPANLSSEKAR